MLRRTSFLGSLSALAVAGIVPILAACNGHVILGNTGDTLQAVTTTKAAAEVNGTGNAAITCAPGWAHPNVCCSAGPDVQFSCGAWEQNPFRACDSGSTTYPNLLSCCDLNDPTKACVDKSPSGTSLPPTPPPPAYCGFACPPGWWAESGGAVPVSSNGSVGSSSGAGSSGGDNGGGTSGSSSGGGVSSSSSSGGSSSSGSGGNIGGYSGGLCCTTYGTGTQCVSQGGGAEPVAASTVCGGYGSSSGSSSGGGGTIALDAGSANVADAAPAPIDAGVPTPIGDDAGIYPGGWSDDGGDCQPEDAGSPYPPGFDGGTASLCDPCPTGWTASDPTQPELCCQTVPGNLTLCFSQASGPATYVGGDDGGSSVPPTGVGTVGSTGSSGWGSGAGTLPDGGVGGPNCSGSDSSCSCEETTNGHTYALDCFATSSGAISCSCTIDGTTTGATPTVDSCQDSSAVPNAFSAASGCGFPL